MIMDFDKALDHCMSLESTISALIKSNSEKQLQLRRLQASFIELIQNELNQLTDSECELRTSLVAQTSKKLQLEISKKQYIEINEKLRELVAVAQKTSNEKKDIQDKNHEASMILDSAIRDFEEVKPEYAKAKEHTDWLEASAAEEESELQDLIQESQVLTVNLHKNDSIIRLLDQQNKFGEQQFDLILNQLPWEPVTERYIKELQQSSDEHIRNLAISLAVQANEIEDLNESLNSKKERKLKILEELSNDLNHFTRRREEAILMDEHYKDIMSG